MSIELPSKVKLFVAFRNNLQVSPVTATQNWITGVQTLARGHTRMCSVVACSLLNCSSLIISDRMSLCNGEQSFLIRGINIKDLRFLQLSYGIQLRVVRT
jgi:hypothetical protein